MNNQINNQIDGRVRLSTLIDEWEGVDTADLHNIGRLFGYKSFDDFEKDKPAEFITRLVNLLLGPNGFAIYKALLGPHGYAIYKTLEARNDGKK